MIKDQSLASFSMRRCTELNCAAPPALMPWMTRSASCWTAGDQRRLLATSPASRRLLQTHNSLTASQSHTAPVLADPGHEGLNMHRGMLVIAGMCKSGRAHSSCQQGRGCEGGCGNLMESEAIAMDAGFGDYLSERSMKKVQGRSRTMASIVMSGSSCSSSSALLTTARRARSTSSPISRCCR